MTRKTENIIEVFAIELLSKLDYVHIYAPDIIPDSNNQENWPIFNCIKEFGHYYIAKLFILWPKFVRLTRIGNLNAQILKIGNAEYRFHCQKFEMIN